MASDYFTERREIGVINVGNTGIMTVDGQEFELKNRDMLYIGKESKEILFSSTDSNNPLYYYIQNYQAHQKYPT